MPRSVTRRCTLCRLAIAAWLVFVVVASVGPFLGMFWIWEPGGHGIWMFAQGSVARYAPTGYAPQPSLEVEVLLWAPGGRNWVDFKLEYANANGVAPSRPPHLLVFPPWLVLLLPTLLLVIPLAIRAHKRRPAPLPGRTPCPGCGYDTTGLTTCPECGAHNDAPEPTPCPEPESTPTTAAP